MSFSRAGSGLGCAAARGPARLAPIGVAPMKELRTRSGIDFFEAIGRGELPTPPISQTLDIWPVEWEPGRMVFQGIPGKAHYNPIGSVHGGWTATMLDSALGCAIHSALPAGKGYTTIELKVNYIRAVATEAGALRAEGKVIHVGGQLHQPPTAGFTMHTASSTRMRRRLA